MLNNFLKIVAGWISKDYYILLQYNEFKNKVDNLETRTTECSVENPYEELLQPYANKVAELVVLFNIDK